MGRAGRRLRSELALAAGMGRDKISELPRRPRGQLKATPKELAHKFPPYPKKEAMRVNELRSKWKWDILGHPEAPGISPQLTPVHCLAFVTGIKPLSLFLGKIAETIIVKLKTAFPSTQKI